MMDDTTKETELPLVEEDENNKKEDETKEATVSLSVITEPT